MKRMFIIIVMISPIQILFGQARDSGAIKNAHFFSLNGYLKDMHILSLPVKTNPTRYGNLLHNRLNIKFDSKQIKAAFEMRNRLWWNYAHDPDLLMSIERLWMEYKSTKMSLKVGRQRINWGMNNVWNPNDIFNAYNIFDFDYEERAGVNGFRIDYQQNDMSAFEFGFSIGKKSSDQIAAINYHFNISGFDWQVIAGFYQNRLTTGFGWQGNIGNVGFKGEVQHYFPSREISSNLIAAVEFDYVVSKGWYLGQSLMYHQRGLQKIDDMMKLNNFQNSPDKLMPTRLNMLTTIRKEINPLFDMQINILYSPGSQLFIFFPSIQYKVAVNTDIDLFMQSYFLSINGNFQPINHMAFLRIKQSF